MMLGGSDIGGDGGASGGSSEVEAGGSGGNRWPRQETMALIRIRSEMDVVFRDSSPKAPLWEQVSRKMAELGFQRSGKKCKEKFENVYKYHKRTKDGRSSKPDGKSYRFFEQLEALEQSPPTPLSFAPPPRQPPATPTTTAAPPNAINSPIASSHVNISSSISPKPLSVAPPNASSTPPILQPQANNLQPSNPTSYSTSSSTSSDEDIHTKGRGTKRKMKDFFEKMMKDVIFKQEEMQERFLEKLEKRERDRMAKEESWRMSEMARLKREHEFLVQERSVAAAKDAAVIAFLQKVTQTNNLPIPTDKNDNAPPPPPQPAMQVQVQLPAENPHTPLPPPPPPPLLNIPSLPPLPPTMMPTKTLVSPKTDNGGSSSRWPKSEIEALISLRTNLEQKYHESAPKGPLWDDISLAMAKLGYNRSSKRCKEKWENINKYYKKVKESSKKRPEDSKTCPYFQQLEAIYKEKAKNEVMSTTITQPQQQWQPQDCVMNDQQDHVNDKSDDEEEEEEEEGGYEVVASKTQPMVTNMVE